MAQEVRDSGSSKPVPPTVSLTLLTWNVNKSFPRGVSQEGSAKRRDTLIPLVLEHLDKQGQRSDVVLIQESTIQEHTARTRWGLSGNYRQQLERRGLRQGIDVTLDVKDMVSLSDQIDSLVPKGTTDHEDALEQADRRVGFADIIVCDSNDRRLMRSDIPPRAFARKLEVTQNETMATIIVVSFHSIHNQPNRRRYISLFFNLMCRLAQVHQCLVLIGGDFNLPVGDWRRDIERGFGGRVHVAEIYPPTPRRRPDNIIDTFAVVYPPGGRIACTLSKPVAVYPFPDGVRGGYEVPVFSDSNREKVKGLLPRTRLGTPNWRILWHDFDHDPVCVTATLEFHHCGPTLHRDSTLHFQYCDPTLRRDIVLSLKYIIPLAFLVFLTHKMVETKSSSNESVDSDTD